MKSETPKVSSITRNSALLLFSTATRVVGNAVLFIGIARLYGPEQFGQFTAAHTVVVIFYIVSDFGLDLLAGVEVARSGLLSQSQVQRLLPFKMGFATISLIMMVIVTLAMNTSRETLTLMLVISLSIIANSIMTFGFAVMRARGQFQIETRTTVLSTVLLLGALIILGAVQAPVVHLVIAFVLSKVIGAAAMIYQSRNLFSFKIVLPRRSDVRSTIRDILPYGIHLLFGSLYLHLDTLLIIAWMDDYRVGVYQAAVKLLLIVLVVPDVLVGAFLPVMSRSFDDNRDRWTFLASVLAKTLLFAGLLLGIVLFIYAGEVINLVYGSNAFADSALILRILSLVLVVRFGVETFGLMLTTSRNQTSRTVVVVAATIIGLVVQSIVIPRFGILGAAGVSVVLNILVGAGYVAGIILRDCSGAILNRRTILTIGVILGVAWILWLVRPPFLAVAVPLMLVVSPIVYYYVGYSRPERALMLAFKNQSQ